MAQSVELLLDSYAESWVRAEWDALADAGLPSERRATPGGSHRPHITLFAGPSIPAAAESMLPEIVADLDLEVHLGACQFFPGTARPHVRSGDVAPSARFVLVRQVVASPALLELQRRVTDYCSGSAEKHFGIGRWSPHVTLARRVSADQASAALGLVGTAVPPTVVVTRCRRWDGTAKLDWLL